MYDIFEKLLNEHGVTAYKVAKETGISTATLTQWKNGTSTPKQDKLQKMADFFGVTVDYLMNGKDPDEKESIFMAKDENERKLIMLCRKAGDASTEERDALVKQFESTIDLYLQMKGIKKGED